jgi:hypothetical protein
MIPRIANKHACGAVDRLEAFQGSNLYGHWAAGHRDAGVYVVYSYGAHYPALVYDSHIEQWYHNGDGYSPSTGRHQSRIGYRGEPRTTQQLKEIIWAGGVVNAVSKRMNPAEAFA